MMRTLLLAITAMSATQAASAAKYFSTDYYSFLQGVQSLCEGLDRVQIGNPYDCQKFVVCCSGQALSFVCRLPPVPGYQIYEVRSPQR